MQTFHFRFQIFSCLRECEHKRTLCREHELNTHIGFLGDRSYLLFRMLQLALVIKSSWLCSGPWIYESVSQFVDMV